MSTALPVRFAAVLEAAGLGVGRSRGSRLCCGFSGGVDSVVTLELLHRLQPQFGFQLEAAHVHHGLSANAGQWAQFCADFCAARNIVFHLCPVSVSRTGGKGVEAAARSARYAALEALGADWLVLGHHADDQAETVLLNLLRGAGVRGAAAMAAVLPPQSLPQPRGGRLRPLLGERRSVIECWATAQGLSWVEDESNAGLAYRRNQLRWRVLPLLEESFPAAVPMLARAADNFRTAEGLLGELAQLDADRCALLREEVPSVVLQRAAVLALSDERLCNLLRWQAAQQGWQPASRQRLFEAVRQLRAVNAGQPLRVVVGEFACCLYREQLWLEAAVLPPPVAQRWQGEASLSWGAGEVVFGPRTGGGIAAAALAAAQRLELAPPRSGMRLRKWAQTAGVPAWWRSHLPVLWLDDQPAWLAGAGVRADFAAAAGEAGVLPCWRGGWPGRKNDDANNGRIGNE